MEGIGGVRIIFESCSQDIRLWPGPPQDDGDSRINSLRKEQ